MFDFDPVPKCSSRFIYAADISISAPPSGPPIGISAAETKISSHENASEDAPSSGVAAAHTMSDQGEGFVVPKAKGMSKAKGRPKGSKDTKRRFRRAKGQSQHGVDAVASVQEHHHSSLVKGPKGRPKGSRNKTASPEPAGPPPPTPGPPDAFTELGRRRFGIHGMRVDSEPELHH